MGDMSMAGLAEILAWHGSTPALAIETGTYRGDRTRMLAEVCQRVITIELSEELWAARGPLPANVTALCGDSMRITPVLAEACREPVLWFLDAHWFDRPDVAGWGQELPLTIELLAIVDRSQPDLIIVDDLHSFGTVHPTVDWLYVTPATLEDVFATAAPPFGPGRHSTFTDQYAVSRAPVDPATPFTRTWPRRARL